MIEINEDLLPSEFVHVRAMREAEKKLYLIAYKKCDGNHSKISEYMGVTRVTVARKLRQYDII